MIMDRKGICFLVVLCIIQMCMSGRIHYEDDITLDHDEIEQIKAMNLTDEQLQTVRSLGISFELYGKLIEAKESTSGLPHFQRISAACAILDPDEPGDNFTIPPDGPSDGYLEKLDWIKNHIRLNESIPFAKKYICPFIRHPGYNEEYANSLGLARYQYHYFVDIQRRSNVTSPAIRAAGARKLCKVYQEFDIIAEIPKAPTELSQDQLHNFSELEEEFNTANDSTRAIALVNICNFLNESVIPSDQAHALRIPVDLYKKIVAIRKEYANDLPIDNRINPVVIRPICKEINRSDGVFDITVPEVSHLGSSQLKEVIAIINRARYAENAKKITYYRRACVFLNESYSDQELAKLSGVSLEKYHQIVEIKGNHQDNSLRGQLALTIELCHVVSPIRENATLSDQQLIEFEDKLEPIGRASIDQSVQLLKDICAWINTNTQP